MTIRTTLLSTVAAALFATAAAAVPEMPESGSSLVGETLALQDEHAPLRPRARDEYLPNTRWAEEHGTSTAIWTRTMMSALESTGSALDDVVPTDIDTWCPGYRQADAEGRRAFWTGLVSAISWYESRFLPQVVGGGSFYGLMQIYPATARGVGCRAESGAELQSGTENLSCAVRIMAHVVPDDRAVAAGGQGLASQWGPMTHRSVREAIATWTSGQSYCQIQPMLVESAPRPPARPLRLAEAPPMVTRGAVSPTAFD